MSRLWQITTLTVIVLLWGATMFAPVLGIDAEIQDNVEVPEWPGFDPSRILDTSQTEAIEEYLDLTLPARAAVVKAKSIIEMKLFHRSPNPDVVLGRDGWLFLAQSLEYGCEGGDLEAVTQRIAELDAALDLQGGRLVVSMIPNKASLYPEKVDFANTGKAACSAENRGLLVSTLEATGVYLDLMGPLSNASAGPEPIYHSNDTHWNDLGAVLAAQAVVEGLTGEPTESWFVRGEDREHIGDLTKLLGLDEGISTPFYSLDRPDLTTRRETNSRVRYGTDTYFSESTSDEAFAYRRVTVIHDSFGPFIKPYLVPLASRVDFFDVRNLDEEALAVSLADSDLSLVLVVERSWYREFVEDFVTADLLGLLGELS